MHELLSAMPVGAFIAALGALAMALVGGIWGAGKWLSRQFQGSLDVRFASIEAARSEAQKLWGQRFEPLERHAVEEPKRWDAISAQIHEVHQDVAGKDLRLTRLEETVRHLPSNDTVANIYRRLDDISALVHGMRGQLVVLEPIQESLSRVNDYLLNQRDT